MKNLEHYIIIIFFITISSKINAQNVIAVIEINSVYDNLYEKSHIDSILLKLKISTNQTYKKMQNESQNLYLAAINICHTVESQKFWEKRLRKLQPQLEEYKKYSIDTIKLLSDEILVEFEKYVYLEIENYIKERKLKILIEKKQLLYYDKSTDITQIIIQRFKQKENREYSFWNLLEQINILLLKYNFEERLNEVLIVE